MCLSCMHHSLVFFLFLLVSGLAAACDSDTPWTFHLSFLTNIERVSKYSVNISDYTFGNVCNAVGLRYAFEPRYLGIACQCRPTRGEPVFYDSVWFYFVTERTFVLQLKCRL